MTYNFDPERWRADQLMKLESELGAGKLSKDDFEKAVADVERRHERMLTRLDSTYHLPSPDKAPT